MSPADIYRFEDRTEAALLLSLAAAQTGLPLADCQGFWDASTSSPTLSSYPPPGPPWPWYFVNVAGHAEGAAEGDYVYGEIVIAEPGGIWGRRATTIFGGLGLVGDLPAARIEIEAGAFSRASSQMVASVQGRYFYNHYAGTVAFEIQTPRTAEGVALHRRWVGMVRAAMGLAGPDLVIPPYDVLEVVEGAGNLVAVRDGERDRSSLSFALQISIPGPAMDYSTA